MRVIYQQPVLRRPRGYGGAPGHELRGREAGVVGERIPTEQELSEIHAARAAGLDARRAAAADFAAGEALATEVDSMPLAPEISGTATGGEALASVAEIGLGAGALDGAAVPLPLEARAYQPTGLAA